MTIHSKAHTEKNLLALCRFGISPMVTEKNNFGAFFVWGLPLKRQKKKFDTLGGGVMKIFLALKTLSLKFGFFKLNFMIKFSKFRPNFAELYSNPNNESKLCIK